MHSEQPSREIRAEIGRVLMRSWDPIGVAGRAGAEDEHDSYVGGVCQLLVDGATAKEISAHLVRIETERLGFDDSEPRMLIPLANRLRRLYARLTASASPPA